MEKQSEVKRERIDFLTTGADPLRTAQRSSPARENARSSKLGMITFVTLNACCTLLACQVIESFHNCPEEIPLCSIPPQLGRTVP